MHLRASITQKLFFFYIFILAQFQLSTHVISFLLFSSVVARTTGDHGMNNKSDVTHGESQIIYYLCYFDAGNDGGRYSLEIWRRLLAAIAVDCGGGAYYRRLGNCHRFATFDLLFTFVSHFDANDAARKKGAKKYNRCVQISHCVVVVVVQKKKRK